MKPRIVGLVAMGLGLAAVGYVLYESSHDADRGKSCSCDSLITETRHSRDGGRASDDLSTGATTRTRRPNIIDSILTQEQLSEAVSCLSFSGEAKVVTIRYHDGGELLSVQRAIGDGPGVIEVLCEDRESHFRRFATECKWLREGADLIYDEFDDEAIASIRLVGGWTEGTSTLVYCIGRESDLMIMMKIDLGEGYRGERDVSRVVQLFSGVMGRVRGNSTRLWQELESLKSGGTESGK